MPPSGMPLVPTRPTHVLPIGISCRGDDHDQGRQLLRRRSAAENPEPDPGRQRSVNRHATLDHRVTHH
jgi:hypothetical protein